MANNLNLSREPNAGRGALDFKITKGYRDVVTVEVKYSSNTSLVKGFTTQLPLYNKAEKALNSIYLVLRTTETDSSIKRLEKEVDAAKVRGERTPKLVIIDARKQKSASHTK